MSRPLPPIEPECSYSEHPRGSAEWLNDVNAIIRGERGGRYVQCYQQYELLRKVAMDLTSEMMGAREVARKMLHIARARGPEPFGLTMETWLLEPLL